MIHTVVGLQLADGGPSRSIPAMADAQAKLGANVHVVDVLFNERAENGLPKLAKFHGIEGAKFLSWIRNSSLLGRSLCSLVKGCEPSKVVLHDHGLWMPQNRLVPLLSRQLDKTLVISPRGMLSAWSLNRRRGVKKILWQFWQKRALRYANGFHATSNEEFSDIRSAGLLQPISVVPNSVRFPVKLPERRNDPSGRKRLLFLSRIHPVKGIKEMLVAFQNSNVSKDWILSIVGPGEEEYAWEVKKLCSQLGLDGRVVFEGAVSDEEKWQRYLDADLFILPSFSENFGLVIAEAMAAGLPVITTTGTPWQSIRDKDLGWWVEPVVSELSKAISEGTSLTTDRLREIGQRGSEYVRSRFSWDTSARELLEFYQSLEK